MEAWRDKYISIHALLAESDLNSAYGALDGASISIHALLAESDPPRVIREPTAARFLSTLSLRRATVLVWCSSGGAFISIHALLAESDCFSVPYRFKVTISIHALLAESDASTFSSEADQLIISIHALLAESDYIRPYRFHLSTKYFYPRSPCGERRLRNCF